MSELKIKVFASDAGTAIRIVGRIDGQSAPVLHGRLKEPDLNLGLPIVLDLEDVDFVGSVGLRTFLVLAKSAEIEGGSVVLVHLQPHVDEVFEMSGLKTVLRHQPSLAAALAECGMPADLCDEAGGEAPDAERHGALGRIASRILPGGSGN